MTYAGEYKFNQRHGRGVIQFLNGQVYNGMFSENRMHGRVCSFLLLLNIGPLTKRSRSTYPWFSSGLLSVIVGWSFAFYNMAFALVHLSKISYPQGVYKWPDGDVYDGEHEFDQKHGQGEYKWHDGRVYDGMFNEGKVHGTVRSCGRAIVG
jgi:hypothetical protein